MTAEGLARLGAELGLDAVGAAPALPYAETERHIRERKERGLFATMGFTTRRPEVSCHPERLLDGARTVVSAALCYWADAEEPGPGEGRLARYTWSDRYAELREKLDALGRRLGGSYRVLVDENDHVDREAAVRAGVAFYGKSTLAITRRHGTWVVLGTLVTDVELEASAPLDAGCGSCTLCIDACPTGALDEPGTLDATRCLSWWTQAPAPVPLPYREPLGASVYGCDICQDVCPWNRGAARRSGAGRLAARLARGRRPRAGRALRPPLRPPQGPPLAAPERARRGRQRGRRGRARRGRALGRRGRRAAARARPLGARPDRREDARVTLLRVLALIRLGLAPLVGLKLLLDRDDFPSGGYATAAWTVGGAYVVVALALLALAYRAGLQPRALAALGVASDFALGTGLMFAFAWEPGQALRAVLFLVVLEAALLFRLAGGLALAGAVLPALLTLELWRRAELDVPVRWDAVVLRVLVAFALGAVVGRLVELERAHARDADARAGEAERLRDELGRRIDVLEATSRAARALASSLDLDEAFAAFVRELRGLLPFGRAAILLAEGDGARVMATAGAGADEFLPPGSRIAVEGSILADVIESGHTLYREDIEDRLYPEEEGLLQLGVRSRVLAPLQLGTRTIGALALSRDEPHGFTREEVELVTLLGRLVATAVQNLRTYEAERATVEELRRLSSLRADFVSLVSHELRSPMAAVIGSARTLQARWRELRPEQREAFLAVIADETSRLSSLVGDVLDTSRIEAGTFAYRFDRVDLSEILRDSIAAAEIGQDEVRLEVELPSALPEVNGDAERLRQLVDNLLSNAIKYSESGGEVRVAASSDNGTVVVRVSDSGPGISPEHQAQIFEKFGRAGGSAKPGTGLGLFLSRSFAEAHGGTLDVDSRPGEGATFTLRLPLEG
jgi:epoxyqueuosine reductase